MAIKRYFAIRDNTITNAWKSNLTTRATGSNMGAADILEVFKIHGQAGTGSADKSEKSRVLVQFAATGSGLFNEANSIYRDRTLGNIPISGSVNFYLRMFNASHSLPTPSNYSLATHMLDRSWDEGIGLDMDNYTDMLYDNNPGSSWVSASSGIKWTSEGSDFDQNDSSGQSASLDSGIEDLNMNITPLVEKWLAGTKENYGLVLRVAPEYEESNKSYYTKKFFGRSSEFFYKRPYIEARWDSSTRDDRGNFHYSSSLATVSDNLNTLYFYNFVRGRLRSIPLNNSAQVVVSLYPSLSASDKVLLSAGGDVVSVGDTHATASEISTGIYAASLSLTASATRLTKLHDVWLINDGAAYTQFHSGSITPKKDESADWGKNITHVTSMPNLKSAYRRDSTERLRLYTREKGWSPTIYNKANSTIERSIVESGSFRITRNIDRLEVVPFSTGSDNHTHLSFDVSGNYFDLDFSMLQAGYSYVFDFSYYDDTVNSWTIQPQKFKFRVEE